MNMFKKKETSTQNDTVTVLVENILFTLNKFGQEIKTADLSTKSYQDFYYGGLMSETKKQEIDGKLITALELAPVITTRLYAEKLTKQQSLLVYILLKLYLSAEITILPAEQRTAVQKKSLQLLVSKIIEQPVTSTELFDSLQMSLQPDTHKAIISKLFTTVKKELEITQSWDQILNHGLGTLESLDPKYKKIFLNYLPQTLSSMNHMS